MEHLEFFSEDEAPKIIEKDRFSVEDRAHDIVELIRAYRCLHFYDLIEADYTKGEIIDTFRALLEILKYQVATVEQGDSYSDLVIKHAPNTDTWGQKQVDAMKLDLES
jgi:chromatin segregation and condensation protein Rec8/ScpA/Scc1 (kleisin family)